MQWRNGTRQLNDNSSIVGQRLYQPNYLRSVAKLSADNFSGAVFLFVPINDFAMTIVIFPFSSLVLALVAKISSFFKILRETGTG